MSQELQRRAREVFLACRNLSTPGERAARAARACDGDAELAAAVERLLEAHEANGGFLEEPLDSMLDGRGNRAFAATIDMRRAAPPDRPGARIGRYKLLEQIGEGGMGVVFMAEQTEPVRRKVALKLMKPGLNTREVVARFEAERQALAMMDHPNIARVFDGGTTESGRSHFVMELVRGIPITEYCDQARLTTRERLELFVQVCRAVQHAHTKGIIHRDLKPSNVLVTLHDGTPMPKVIDFGIAKATNGTLTDKTLFTHFAQLVGTPLYMSPEQAALSALDVDTRSDIYSLGVLLYELLTGTTPFERQRFETAGYDELRRIIREDEPPRPSQRLSTLNAEALTTVCDDRRTDVKQLRQSLRGELDWIVMKCLEKDRTRRYETASGLARDVERFLNDEPVQACPPSAGYRIRKYARRYRGFLTATLLILAALLAGTAVSVWQALAAHEARRVAEERGLTAQRERAKAEDAAAWSETLLYAAEMKLASDAIANQDVQRAAELLARHVPLAGEPDRHGFEWHYFQKRVTRPEGRCVPLDASIHDVAYSPDGKLLAVAADAEAVQIYDTATWQLKRTIATGCESLNGVDWSPDGARIAVACADGSVRIWSGVEETPMIIAAHGEGATHEGEANDVLFAHDGKTVYSCGDDALACRWDVRSGRRERVFEGHGREVEELALSPDGTQLATASSDSSFAVWGTRTGNRIHKFKPPASRRVVCIAFSPDGRLIAAGEIGGRVFLGDVHTGKHVLLTREPDGVEGIAFFPGRRMLATVDRGGAICLRGVPTKVSGSEVKADPRMPRWIAHEGRALALAITPDGTRLISGGHDRQIRVWKPDLHVSRWSPSGLENILDFTIDPHDRLYVAGERISVWDLRERRLVDSFAATDDHNPWQASEYSADGRLLVLVQVGRVVLFEFPSKRIIREWRLEERIEPYRLAVSADGRYAALSDYTDRETVRLFDLRSSQPPRQLPARQSERLSFSPDGRLLAVGHMDDLLVYDHQTDQEPKLWTGHSSTLADAAFSPDGELLATVSHDRLLEVRRAASGADVFSIVAHRDPLRSVCFAPDGRTIATAGEDGIVKLWHTSTGQPLGSLTPENGTIIKVCFSSDGKRLVALTADETLVVYDATEHMAADR
ncbi:MAG TPA: protein kinase [Planctomycetaceae bacterium]|nr:protein kinase [Planctomycetaceae bacterium]